MVRSDHASIYVYVLYICFFNVFCINLFTAQLVCPLAYDDPYNAWDRLSKELLPLFPLRDITWKSPLSSSSQITIDKLSVRCIPTSASLFKDTDHPFRWFLAPYVNIYIFVCDSTDVYKSRKNKLRQWIDSLSGHKRSSWIVIYLPMGTQTTEVYQKIYNKLSSEFYFDKVGDRTSVMFLHTQQYKNQNSPSDMLDKIKEGIITSFQQRYVQE